jgi:hypothetical protein
MSSKNGVRAPPRQACPVTRATTASLPGDARLGARALPESLGRAKNGWCRYRLNATNNGRNTTTLKVKDPRTHRVRAWRQPGMGRGGRGM